MARRRRIIEGTWTCSSCRSKGILGRHKTCPSCGSPRENDETNFDFGARKASSAAVAATVSDAELLKKSSAGADWHCDRCGAGNPGDLTDCRTCGSPRHAPPPPEPEPEPINDREPPSRTPWFSGLACLGMVGCSGLIMVMFCALSYWGAQTHEEPGTVAAREWARSITVEEFVPTRQTGWRSELTERAPRMPVEGRGEEPGVVLGDCQRQQRTTRQVPDGTKRVCTDKTRQVACGQEEVCSQRSRSVKCGTREECEVRDLGNGFAEEVCDDVDVYCDEAYEDCSMETRYCDEAYTECEDVMQYRSEPVFEDQCDYETWQWTEVGTQHTAGRDHDAPVWSDVSPTALQRTTRTERYGVSVAWGEGEQYAIEPDSEAAFALWPMGAVVAVEVSNLGVVRDCKVK